MARARNIKPATFTNEFLAECSPLARLLFIGLWTIADKEGRLEDRPRKIKYELLGYDECEVDTLLDELFSRGFIVRYGDDNNKYIQVVNFVKHQNPHPKEPTSNIPEPCKNISYHGKNISKNASSLIPSSLIPLPNVACAEVHEFLSTAEQEQAATPEPTPAPTPQPTPKPEKQKRGERLEAYLEREGVEVTAKAWGDWARTEGMTVAQIDATMAQFRDWWRSAPGGKGVKADWPATWRGWVRRELSKIREQERRDALFKKR